MSARIISIADHLPRFTAQDLLQECREHMSEPDPDRDFGDFLEGMPEVLTMIADHIMCEVDYQRIKFSKTGISLRCLVGLAAQFEDHLGQIAQANR